MQLGFLLFMGKEKTHLLSKIMAENFYSHFTEAISSHIYISKIP